MENRAARITEAHRLYPLALLLIGLAMFSALFVVAPRTGTHAASACSVWYHCPITQRYGVNQEHGIDLWTQGLPVTALRSGTVTFVHQECWEYPCVMDITWRLDFPAHSCGSTYMYTQIRTASVHVGQHVSDWQLLGYSGSFIEYGLTPDYAYGVSNWRWGIDILKCFPWL